MIVVIALGLFAYAIVFIVVWLAQHSESLAEAEAREPEVTRLRADRDKAVDEYDRQLREWVEEREQLRAALREYGVHLAGCPLSLLLPEPDVSCDCGLTAVLEGAADGDIRVAP